MILLIAIFLLLEAVFEGLKTRGKFLASELIEAGYLVGISCMAFAWVERNTLLINYTIVFEFWKVLVGYLLLRFALFDLIWNLCAGKRWSYYGTTKLYDRLMRKLGGWGWFIKGCAGFWGLLWLLGLG